MKSPPHSHHQSHPQQLTRTQLLVAIVIGTVIGLSMASFFSAGRTAKLPVDFSSAVALTSLRRVPTTGREQAAGSSAGARHQEGVAATSIPHTVLPTSNNDHAQHTHASEQGATGPARTDVEAPSFRTSTGTGSEQYQRRQDSIGAGGSSSLNLPSVLSSVPPLPPGTGVSPDNMYVSAYRRHSAAAVGSAGTFEPLPAGELQERRVPSCPAVSPFNRGSEEPDQLPLRMTPPDQFSDNGQEGRVKIKDILLIFLLNRFHLHGSCLSVASALQQGFTQIHVAGYGTTRKPKRPDTLPSLLRSHCRRYSSDTLVMVVDGGDTHFTGGPKELLNRLDVLLTRHRLTVQQFRAQKLTVVASESFLNLGDEGRHTSIDDFPHRYELEQQLQYNAYPNTGMYLGFKDSLLESLEYVFDSKHQELHGIPMDKASHDQVLFVRLWKPLELSKRFLIDHHSDVAQTMWFPEPPFVHPGMFPEGGAPMKCPSKSHEWCFEPMNVLPVNRLRVVSNGTTATGGGANVGGGGGGDGERPIFLHWNGASKFLLPEYVRCYHFTPTAAEKEKEREKSTTIVRDWRYHAVERMPFTAGDIEETTHSSVTLSDVCSLSNRIALCDVLHCI